MFAPSAGAAELDDGEFLAVQTETSPYLSRFNTTPCFNEFDPSAIPYQLETIKLVRSGRYDYSRGPLEILLSGAVGSAKSVLAAHLGLTHVLINTGARLLLGRRSMPDLRATILSKIIEHMTPALVEKKHYIFHRVTGTISFSNGSQILCRSWADGKYLKFRSLELSAAIFEELTENDDDDQQAYKECFNRIGRLSHVKENFMLSCTNPDSPKHWAYKHFFVKKNPSRFVFKSRTVDNPFLSESYSARLRENLDPKEAKRLLEGEWIEIISDQIYHSYDAEKNYTEEKWNVVPGIPIRLTHDFNIGLGKPMSAAAFQYLPDKDEFHFFEQFVVMNCSTEEMMKEIDSSGLFEYPNQIIVHGDAAGKNKDTRTKKSDYDIILNYLIQVKQKKPEFKLSSSNPPIRTRHNLVNAYCKNMSGKHRLIIHRCPKIDEALRLTAIKKGSAYQEDDSKDYQHIGTAVGYGIYQTLLFHERKRQSTIIL